MNRESNTETQHECKVRCTVRPGLFEEEFIASFHVLAPDRTVQQVETIVEKDSLEDFGGEVSGSMPAVLRAWLVKEVGDAVAIVLPQSTSQNGPSVLVPKSDVL